MPYLSLGFLVMCVCSVISVLISASYMHQRNYMKVNNTSLVIKKSKFAYLDSIGSVSMCIAIHVMCYCYGDTVFVWRSIRVDFSGYTVFGFSYR